MEQRDHPQSEGSGFQHGKDQRTIFCCSCPHDDRPNQDAEHHGAQVTAYSGQGQNVLSELQKGIARQIAVKHGSGKKQDKHAEEDGVSMLCAVKLLDQRQKGKIQRGEEEQGGGKPRRTVIGEKAVRKPALNAQQMLEELNHGIDQLIEMARSEGLRNGGEGDGVDGHQKVQRIEPEHFPFHVRSVFPQAELNAVGMIGKPGQEAAEHEEKRDAGDGAEPAGILKEVPVVGVKHIDVEKGKNAKELHLVFAAGFHAKHAP